MDTIIDGVMEMWITRSYPQKNDKNYAKFDFFVWELADSP